MFTVVPYSKGISESFGNICGKAGAQVQCKGPNTVKKLLVASRDKDSICKKGVIYRYRYDQPGCTMEYIGETGRNFGERYKEHLRAPPPILDHSQTTRHIIKPDNFSIVGRESQGITRTIKEAMCIRVNDSPLNRNLGKYKLLHIWDGQLQDMLALHLQLTHYSSHTTNSLGHPSNIRWGTKFFLGVHMSIQGCLPSPHLTVGTNSSTAECPSQGCLPSSPLSYILSHIFPPNFGTKSVSITFSLRPEEALLVFTL